MDVYQSYTGNVWKDDYYIIDKWKCSHSPRHGGTGLWPQYTDAEAGGSRIQGHKHHLSLLYMDVNFQFLGLHVYLKKARKLKGSQ